MVDETIPEKCETLYNKLNTFVESEISRDVTPQISNLNSRINALEPNLVRVKEVNGNTSSISAGGTSTKTFTVPACPSGYNWKYLSTSTGWGTVSNVELSGTTLTVTLLNVSNSSHDISFRGALVYYPKTIEAEPHISVTATNPYLLEGEITDLVVSLTDEFGLPLTGKTVTINDGTSSYNGITNNDGLFTLYDMNSGTYTATYSGQSSSCTVYGGVVFYDNATSQSKNTHWKIRTSDQSDLTVTVGTGGTTLTNASTSVSRFYFANPDDSTSDSPPITISDFVVEADIFDSSFTDSDSQIAFLLQGQTANLNLKGYTAPYHIKIEKEGTSAKHYLNDTLIRTTTISSRPNYYIGFQLYKRASITFRDYVIREI